MKESCAEHQSNLAGNGEFEEDGVCIDEGPEVLVINFTSTPDKPDRVWST